MQVLIFQQLFSCEFTFRIGVVRRGVTGGQLAQVDWATCGGGGSCRHRGGSTQVPSGEGWAPQVP